jgi:single-stranded-DNA-specific exonuclease
MRTTGYLPATARILAARGLTSIASLRDFLNPNIKNLPHPDGIQDLSLAAERIIQAILFQEPLLVFGDYDADGVTATALVYGFLSRLNPKTRFYLPHREREGYGLKPLHIPLFAQSGIRLVITVDCGISSHEAIAEARKIGMDVVVTDHHRPGDTLPQAWAVVDPQRRDCPSGLGNMAGVGLAFYLVMAIRKGLRERGYWEKFPEPPLLPETDLVALGTVADLVPLTGINRTLVHAGLNTIRKAPRPGIQALCRVAGIRCEDVDSEAIAFRLAPRINAAGRMAHPDMALRLLSAPSLDTAMPLALELDRLNSTRQVEENRILTSIEDALEKKPDLAQKPALVLHSQDWSLGVIGIVASRLVRRYHKPAVLIATQDNLGQASARSIPGVDLFAALSACSPLLEQYGGHAMAAGFRIQDRNIPAFQRQFCALAAQYPDLLGYPPPFMADALVDLDTLTPRLLAEMQALGPFGMGNAPPLFAARHLEVLSSLPMGSEGCHRRLLLRQPSSIHTRNISAVVFGVGKGRSFPPHIDVCLFRLRREWAKEEGVQMQIEAWY